MRLGYASTTATQYYDRSPITKMSFYAAGAVAPHGITQRWVYTVPTGKKAYLQSEWIASTRSTAAAPAGDMQNYLELIPVATSGSTMLSAQETSNAIGVQIPRQFAGQGLLVAGDVIAGSTVDASTGGTYGYNNVAWYCEFALSP